MAQRGFSLLIKKAVDRTAAAVGLAVVSPVIAATAVAIFSTMGRPVLFRQERPGFHGKPFHVYKFRTMRRATDASGRLLPDADRLTRLGKFLRSSSLDELPQLWNVLRGEVSLVGPRPLLMQYLPLYNADQKRRHDVLPGMTGWAQVNGRNAISWEEKFRLDVWYVDHWSLLLDVKILAMTAARMIRPRDISQDGHVTMPNFMGTSPPN